MLPLYRTTMLLGLFLLAATGAAQDDRQQWEARFELNYAAASTDYASWGAGGIGKLRYDEHDDALGIGRLLLDYRARITPTWGAHVSGDYVADADSGFDLTEAYFEWRPIPKSANRQRLKLGAFFPDVSLENTQPGWGSAYTISSSAINTWIAEEIRTIGAEWSWQTPLGGRGSGRQLEIFAAMYFGNDPAGALLTWKGWSLHDRQTRIDDRLPLPELPLLADGAMFSAQAPWTEPFKETDDQPGYYFGGKWRFGQRALLTSIHYDNHADPLTLREGHYGWATRFNQVGVQLELPAEIGLISQLLRGRTAMGPVLGPARAADIDFESYFVLLTRRLDKHRLSLRYDSFDAMDRDRIPLDDNSESGDAWTLAYRYDHSPRLLFDFEWLTVRTARPAWGYFDLPVAGREDLLQFQVGYRLGSAPGRL